MEGFGLDLASGSPLPCMIPGGTIVENGEEDGKDEEDEGNGEDPAVPDEESTAHLDPFEREWSERWLNGVVRRAQSWLGEQESMEELQHGDDSGAVIEPRGVEAVLRDATAVLAMMAGTSGELVSFP